MGIGDVVSKVVTEFKADTKDHKKKLRELKGIEKDRQRELIDGLEKQNKKLDDQIGTMGKVALAVGVVAGAYVTLKAGFEAYAKRQQVLASGAGKNLEQLRKASQGLVSDTDLLTTESALLNGAMKMTGAQMEKAQKFMLALRKEGNDYNEVQKEVTRAFVELNVEGLKKFGVNIKAASGSTEAMTALLKEADKHIAAFGGDLGIAGDDVNRTMTALKNSTDNLALAWGEFANDVLPPLVNGLARVLTNLKNIVGWGKAAGQALGGVFVKHSKETKKWIAASPQEAIAYGMQDTIDESTGMGVIPSIAMDMWGQSMTEAAFEMFTTLDKIVLNLLKQGSDPRGAVQQRLGKMKEAGFITTAQGKSYYKKVAKAWTVWNMIAEETGVEKFSLGDLPSDKKDKKKPGKGPKKVPITFAGIIPTGEKEYPGVSIDAPTDFDFLGKPFGGFEVPGVEKGAIEGPTGKERLASMFGEPNDIFTIANAYGALNEAVVGSFGAWIDGTESVGAAFKRMTKEILKSIAMQSAAEALKYTAYGIAALVDPTLGSSSAYFTSAAKFGAAAAVAGALSREIGGGGAPSTAAGAMARGGGGGSRQQTIILGADFESDSARRRAHRLNDILSQANRLGAGETVVEFG